MSYTRYQKVCRPLLAGLFLVCTSALAIEANQIDDFQDGTTQSWIEGGPSPNPPASVASGGPEQARGDNDLYISNASTGGGGPGSHWVQRNTTQWTGDYIDAGISAIAMKVRVTSGTAYLRVGFEGSGATRYISTLPVTVAQSGNWQQIYLPIGSPDMTPQNGVIPYANIMSTVSEMRIISDQNAPDWRGDTVALTVEIDDIIALTDGSVFAGRTWSAFGGGFPPASFLEEEYCFGAIDFVIADDDNWTAAGDDVCYGRTTNNAIPPREYENFDGATFPTIDDFGADSSQPLVSAGGNLLEAFGLDEFMVEQRLATVLAEPSDSDLLILGGFEQDPDGSDAFVHMLVKFSPDAAASRLPSDVEGRWYLSSYEQALSRLNVNTESVVAGIRTVDLQSGGVCTFVESQVFQETAYDTTGEAFFAAQFNLDATNLTNRGVIAGLADASLTACTYEIDTDDYLSVSFTLTDASGSVPMDVRYHVSDDNNYLVAAPDPGGVSDDPVALQVGYRAPSALPSNAIDGDFLFYLNGNDFEATGLAHSMFQEGLQEFDLRARGIISFDSSRPGVVPAGQSGNWYVCDIEIVANEIEMQADGVWANFEVTTNVDFDGERFPISGCDYNVAADGALLVNVAVTEPGDETDESMLQGYVNNNGELITLINIETNPEPPGATVDLGSILHLIGMKYTGNPRSNDDGDLYSNLEEFLLPLPPVLIQALAAVQNVGGSASPEVAAVLSGSLNGYVRDASTDALIGSQTYSFNRDPLDIGVADINGAPALAVLVEDSTGRAWVEVRDAATGNFVSNVWFSSGYSPIALTILPDMNGNNISEVAVLMTKDSDNRAWVHIKDASTLAYINNVWFSAGFTPLDVEMVPNLDGNAGPEVAVLMTRDSDSRTWVHTKDAGSGAYVRDNWFQAGFTPKDLAVINNLDGNPGAEVAVLFQRDNDNRTWVHMKDTLTGAYVKNVWFDAGFTPTRLETIPDLDTNVGDELAVLATKDADGRAWVLVRDALSGNFVRNVWFQGGFAASDFAVLPEIDANPGGELAVLGEKDNGQMQVEIKDAKTNAFINQVNFP